LLIFPVAARSTFPNESRKATRPGRRLRTSRAVRPLVSGKQWPHGNRCDYQENILFPVASWPCLASRRCEDFFPISGEFLESKESFPLVARTAVGEPLLESFFPPPLAHVMTPPEREHLLPLLARISGGRRVALLEPAGDAASFRLPGYIAGIPSLPRELFPRLGFPSCRHQPCRT